MFLSNFNYQQTWISPIVKTEPVGGTTFPPMALALARSTGVVTGAPLKGVGGTRALAHSIKKETYVGMQAFGGGGGLIFHIPGGG